jgi:CRISPR system Cascade subunit CasD
MQFLLLRLEAPMMAFGAVQVDAIGPTRTFPGQAQICGLLGNALGYVHQDADRLEALQRRLRLAVSLVEPGERLRDYQTVDLGRAHLVGTGWTTRGAVEERAGASSETTHIRQRWYLADARLLVALTLDPADEAPTLDTLYAALIYPARPLFIGRKNCMPTAPIALGLTEAADVPAALRESATRLAQADAQEGRRTRRPAEPVAMEFDQRLPPGANPLRDEAERLVDGRDWRNQMHTRERSVVRTATGTV